MTTNPDFYRTLQVSKTFKVSNGLEVTSIVTQLVDFIEKNSSMDGFSVRILLPRGDETDSLARKWGASLRTGLLLALKRREIRPNLREVRYVHDQYHYGWILMESNSVNGL
jgi:hypothetical protein